MIFSIFHLSYWELALGQFTSKKNMMHGKNFLVTCTQLYMSLYRSVRQSVGPSIRDHFLFFGCLELKGEQISVTAPYAEPRPA